ncbi:MAG: saccharopine dehydrogenase NADP-binding domain-containing protein [bacterium]
MKIAVFGGAGDMGSEAVRDLVKSSAVKSVVIADYNERGAERLVKEVGGKAVAKFVDANHRQQLVEIMKGADAALSCLGPFYKYEELMVRAAIEARVNYVSISDDFDAAEAVLALDKDVRKAAITVLTGMGWTPGMSNVIARRGIDRMDKATRVHIAWAGSADDSKGLAVIKHTLHIFTGKVPTFSGGKWMKVTAGSGKEMVEFPEPIGKIPVYHLGHPEPVTIPHFISGLEEVTLKGSVLPLWLNKVSTTLARARLTDTARKRDMVSNFVHRAMPIMGRGGKGISGLRVDVHGEKKGKEVHYSYAAVDNMGRLTGIPASIGTIMMGSGKIKRKGVVVPEIVIDPEEFIAELKSRKITVHINEK